MSPPIPPPPAGWTPELVDVPAYLARVGIAALPGPTAAGLRDLHRAHVLAIPFENLDIVLGRGIDVSLPAVQAKLVARRRGGYCYEHNTLFGAVLDRAGFEVTRLAARVRLGASFVRARTHMLLVVQAEGRPWLADVGFGGDGLLEPVPLEHGQTSRQGEWTYRVVREDGPWNWALHARRPDGWVELYGFTLEPQHPIDYVMANHFTSRRAAAGDGTGRRGEGARGRRGRPGRRAAGPARDRADRRGAAPARGPLAGAGQPLRSTAPLRPTARAA
ncbi:MAG: arylamine N-acetyltransferase [Chloroflexi bacterium]|nr:MAG: arylamine N-acetyltransferase [Chloroflexota bacterium]